MHPSHIISTDVGNVEQLIKSKVAHLLRVDHSPSVEVRESKVAVGGQGLFATKSIPAGEVFALYSGIAYKPNDLPLIHALKPTLLMGNEYEHICFLSTLR
jgi:hypothetical protein